MKKTAYYFLVLYLLFTNQQIFGQNQPFICGFNDNALSEKTLKALKMAPVWLVEKQARKAADELYVCRIIVIIDSDTYSYFEKDTARIKYEVMKTIEKVSKVYEAEINTQLVVTYIKIWKDQKTDPYFGITHVFGMLGTTSSLWQKGIFKNIPFDKIMYLPTKTPQGYGGLAADFINVSPFGNSMIIAHELGHNFGSPHTHNCSWPGGPIDFCYPAEGGNCYENVLEKKKGTILSACQKEFTFHPLCRALMRHNAESELIILSKTVNSPVLPDTIIYDGNPFIIFDPVVMSEDYYYELSQTADFKEIIHADSTYIQSLSYTQFNKNISYYLRIKSRNRYGTSGWSNVARIILDNYILMPPALKISDVVVKSNGNLFIAPDYDGELPFELDKDANGYEAEMYTATDNYDYKSLRYKVLSGRDEKFLFKPFGGSPSGAIFWRVRAVKNNNKGAWSEFQKLYLIQKDNLVNYPFYDINNAPLNFPITYKLNTEGYDIKFTLSTTSDFNNPVMEKLISNDEYSYSNLDNFSVMSGQLMPDTRYYLKIESIPPARDYWFENSGPVFRRVTSSFKTRSADLLKKYQLFSNENTPGLGRTYYRFLFREKNIFLDTESGISRIDAGTLKAETFTRDNTNGLISNRLEAVNTDSLGNLWAVQVSSKLVSEDSELPFFVMRQFDGRTMELLKSKDFIVKADRMFFSYIDGNSQLAVMDTKIGSVESGEFKSMMEFGSQFFIADVISSKSYLWIRGIEVSTGEWRIKRYHRGTKRTDDITPAFSTQSIAIDRNENVWAAFENNPAPAIGKYDGNKWTIYNSDNSPIRGFGIELYLDKFDNVYVRSATENVIYHFDGKKWETPVSFSDLRINKFTVDGLGKIWAIVSNNALLRVDPCKQIVKPNLVSASFSIGSDKPFILEAKGCNSVIWNWQNKEEHVYEKLVSDSNKIEVNPKSTTIYQARCYDNGCSGEENTFKIAFKELYARKVVKDQICQGDSVSIQPLMEGDFGAESQLSAIIYSSGENFRIPLKSIDGNFKFKTDNTIPVGKYWLKVSASSPQIVSRDSIAITILPLPIVSILGKDIICFGDSTSLFASTKGGAGPYMYNWKHDSFSGSTPDSVIRRIDKPGAFSIQVTDNKGCISNTATIELKVLSLPKVSIMGKNNICAGEVINILAEAKDGIAPYIFNWKQGNFSESTSDSIMRGIDGPAEVSVQVRDSKGCVSNTVNHLITKSDFSNFRMTINGPLELIANATVMLSVPFVVTYTYQWYKDNRVIEGATGNSFTAKMAGNYHVQANEEGCGTKSDVVTVSVITATEPEKTDALNLKVFPNPGDGNFIVEYTLTDNTTLELSVFDIAGKIIWQKRTKGIGVHTAQLNLSEYPSGTYLLVGQKDKSKQTVKLEKQ